MNAFKSHPGMIFVAVLVLVVCSIPAMHGARHAQSVPALRVGTQSYSGIGG